MPRYAEEEFYDDDEIVDGYEGGEIDLDELEPEELDEVYEMTLDEIDAAYESGEISEDEAEELEELAEEDYLDQIERLEEIYGMEYEPEDEYAYAPYGAYNGDLAEFRAGNDFGNAVLERVVEMYEDPEEGLLDLADALEVDGGDGYVYGVDPEDLLGLIAGDYAPDDNLSAQIAEALGYNDEDSFSAMLALGMDARDRLGIEDEDYDDDEDDYDDIEDDLEDVAEAVEETYSRTAQLEAQFAAAQEAQEVGDVLDANERAAAQLVREGRMPPSIYNDYFGAFESERDRFAAFSQVCGANSTSPRDEVMRQQAVIEAFDKIEEPLVSFSMHQEPELSPEEYREMENLTAIAKRNVENRRASSSYSYLDD